MGVPPDLTVSPSERQALLALARRTLEACVAGDSAHVLETFLKDSLQDASWLRPLPCFVTLFTRAHRLRGCIGCTETKASLAANVHRFTRLAALEDPRFPAVAQGETSGLDLHISVLGPLAPLSQLESLVLGRHGLVVQKKHRRGLLLATVATDYGWTRERFLRETFIKAGLNPTDREGAEMFQFEQVEFGDKSKD